MSDLSFGTQSNALVNVYRLLTAIHGQRDIEGKMQAVVDAVVAAVGFTMAALNVVCPDGSFLVVAVAGSDDARRELLGARIPAAVMEAEFAAAEEWGLLRFIPYEKALEPYIGSWTPDLPAAATADAWQPSDALLAPLHTTAGDLIGVLSVDLPFDGRRPSLEQRSLLELLATEAAIALDNGMLAERLRVSEEVFRQAFDGSGGGMTLVGIERDNLHRFARVNPAFCEIVGYGPDILLEMAEEELTHPDDHFDELGPIHELIAGKSQSFRREKRLLHQGGDAIWVTVTSTIARGQDGTPLYCVNLVEDISLKRTELEALHYQANHDVLTNLPHRAVVMASLSASIDLAERTGLPGAVMFLDLNDFKIVNDQHGHAIGDQLLVMLAGRIRSAVREDDLVGRLGGDEFVVIADNVTGPETAHLAERIRSAVAAPFTSRDAVISVSVSVGISAVGTHGGDAGQILRDADHAMYRDKIERRRNIRRIN